MDDLARALDRALDAAGGAPPAVAAHVERAVALARFQVRDPYDGPIRREPLSEMVPQPPERPLLPALAKIPGSPLIDALEELQYQLVWAADCAEFTDATNNAAQYLRAAGHLDLAARATLALAGPGLGVVLAPPVTVRDLAASLAVQLTDLLPDGQVALGDLPPSESGVFASFVWDIHHEQPVRSAQELGPRELTEFSVHFDRGRAALPHDLGPFIVQATHGDAFRLSWKVEGPPPPVRMDDLEARVRAITTPEELSALAPVYALDLAAALGAPDAFACTVDVHMSSWRLTTPEGPLRFGEWIVVAALDGEPSGEPVPGVELPAALAVSLGKDDVVRALWIQD